MTKFLRWLYTSPLMDVVCIVFGILLAELLLSLLKLTWLGGYIR